MCKERWRTRDLLLKYGSHDLIPNPSAEGLGIIYPWENINLSILEDYFYKIAFKNGYQDTKEKFWQRFTHGSVVFGTADTFPAIGDERTLYFDQNTEVLYYFKHTETINEEIANENSVIIMDSENDEGYNIYIPIRAYLIEDIILGIYGGSSTDVT